MHIRSKNSGNRDKKTELKKSRLNKKNLKEKRVRKTLHSEFICFFCIEEHSLADFLFGSHGKGEVIFIADGKGVALD
ncbi:hypothetical protein MSSAC_2612 [Methanosarcina siciliae C2J]|uniref:Uncharacterized protein n=1 Tax=Methanosarcina siciliae C2J TaxID=1434118 RepID=A0A0E3PNJ4_9EURY|nr:hypothetical protein MSSAC_2612 [Methanosarcina siciliae C2J]